MNELPDAERRLILPNSRRIITPPADWYSLFASKKVEKTTTLQDIRNKAARYPRWFIENHLVIAVKKRQDKKLIMTRNQLQLWDKIEEKRLLGIPIRLIVLKSRQVGISTLCAAYGFTRWWSERNFNALIMAHLKPVTTNLFKKNRKFYAELDPAMRIPLERSNKQELIMDMSYGGSQFFLETSGSSHAVRSQTLHFFQGSEAAFYSDLDEVKEALEASVPDDDDDTAIIWESTGFGAGTPFHELWRSGFDDETIYESIFLNWADDPQHWHSVESDLIRDRYLERIFAQAPHLKDRMEHYGLRPEQIIWYFITCKNKYKGEWVKMQQEYPCDPDEAFLASGATVIPTMVIQAYRTKTRDGIIIDPLSDWSTDTQTWKKCDYLERDKNVYLEIFQMPVPNRHYLISVDTASGHGADNSCAMVFDIVTQNVVAELHGKIDPKLLAKWCMRLGTAYNHAVICIETNGLGLSTLTHMEDKYVYLYRQRTRGSVEGTRMTDRLGWHMSEDLRWNILINLRRNMMERLDVNAHPEEFIPSKAIISELATFIQPKTLTNKPQAEKGCHDDRVIALAIGVWACIEEIQMRPDIAPIAHSRIVDDNGSEELDVERLEAMIEDPNWTGLEDDWLERVEAVGPFVGGVRLDEDADDSDWEFEETA